MEPPLHGYEREVEQALHPSVAPMLARLARELPAGDFVYEPKWDGFRCLAFRSSDGVDLRSRNQRPLARYFPEIVEGLAALSAGAFALDGEIVVATADGFDFPALLARLHPAASRVDLLRRETPASFIAFDVLAVAGRDLRASPFAERRRALVDLLSGVPPPLFLTPSTEDREMATAWLDRFQGSGIDGVVAKARDLRYEPGKRAMVKVKRERTVDCVVAGLRTVPGEGQVSSLLLGLYDEARELRHVGVASSFTGARRTELFHELLPLAMPLEGHPWQEGFLLAGGPIGRLKGAAGRWTPDMEMDWVPLRPERVCEVAYDQVDGQRFWHPARFVRWRPDRDASSCAIDQLASASAELTEVLPLR